MSSIINNIFGKLKKSTAFEYISNWFASSTDWNPEKLQKDITNCLIKLDFRLELASSIADQLIQELKKYKELTKDIVKEQLAKLLVVHYSNLESTQEKNQQKLSDFEKIKNLNLKKDSLNVFFIAGSNGVGKTSFIAKLVYLLKVKYKLVDKILLVAGDTFRAGAVDQLDILAKQLKVDIMTPNLPEKASALIYRALKEHQNNYELIILDSAGRQYNNQNLLLELKKQYSIIEKILSKPAEESFLILDSTLGTYAQQELSKLFETIPVTALVLTKMDSTTRGGVIYNLRPKYSIPIKFICFGEGAEDIELFEINSITSQLLDSIFTENLLLS